MKTIARIESDFPEKFGIPRQSGLAETEATVVFEQEFAVEEALRGIEDFSHLWLIWEFSETRCEKWSPTVRPPRLGGNKRMGVFATRSPFRPNPIGLSCVKLLSVEHTQRGTVLRVSGADLMNGTPIYDIKPYLSFTDSHPDARGGFADEKKDYSLKVSCDESLLHRLPENKRSALMQILSGDPRPQYIDAPSRVFGFSFAGFEIKFTVCEGILTVEDIIKLS
ncbi:MAG: tRNA (N6-threonylcarbamoyladenosine(37)-N6)-methyltransferase TrmO [Ruminococcus sp.]